MANVNLVTDEYIYLIKTDGNEVICAFQDEKKANEFKRINIDDGLNIEIEKISFNPSWVKMGG